LRPDWRYIGQQPECAGQNAPRYSRAQDRYPR
jgi:hypothetical protein